MPRLAPAWGSLARTVSESWRWNSRKAVDDRARGGGSKWRSFLIPGVCAAEVLFLIVAMYVNDCPEHSDFCVLRFLGRLSFQPFRENPLLGPSSATLLKLGGLSIDRLWCIFTCIWLHAGILHLVVNILSLLYIGIPLEQEFGFGRIGMIFFLSGIGGSLFGTLFIQHHVSAGASTPLFGLLGAMLSELITNLPHHKRKFLSLMSIFCVSSLNLAIGIFPHTGNVAPIGGFVLGVWLGFMFLMQNQHDSNSAAPGQGPKLLVKYGHRVVLWVISAILLCIGFITLIILALHGVNASANCGWCQYFVCVPSPWWNCNNDEAAKRATCKYVISGGYMFLRCMNNKRAQLFNGFYSGSSIKMLCASLCRG